jgi:hypothetical protein
MIYGPATATEDYRPGAACAPAGGYGLDRDAVRKQHCTTGIMGERKTGTWVSQDSIGNTFGHPPGGARVVVRELIYVGEVSVYQSVSGPR